MRELNQAVVELQAAGAKIPQALEDGNIDMVCAALSEDEFEQAMVVSEGVVQELIANNVQVIAINRDTGMAHAVAWRAIRAKRPETWLAVCGWKFKPGNAVFTKNLDSEHRCNKRACAIAWAQYPTHAGLDDEDDQ